MRLALSATLISLLLSPLASASPRVAVQPFGGPETEAYRRQVAKIIGRHGFKVVTSLASVSGTSQYPGLAKEKQLSAFVVADVDDRGERIALSILVWQGLDGSVIGRWEVSGSKKLLPGKLATGLWKHLGPALRKARAPASDEVSPAEPGRYNAGPPSRQGAPRRKATRPSRGKHQIKSAAVEI